MKNNKEIIYQILYPKQKECLDFFNVNNLSSLFFLKTGTGKTKCALSWLEHKLIIQPEINKILLICPACKVADWEFEMLEWQQKGVYSNFKFVRLDNSKTNWETLQKQQEKTIFFMSHQMFRMLEKHKREKVFKTLWNNSVIIFDEAAALKNISSDTSKTMWAISKYMHHNNCAYLTATPRSNKTSDLFVLLKLSGLDFGNGDNLWAEYKTFCDYFIEYKIQKLYNPWKHTNVEIKTEIGIQQGLEDELNKLIHLRAYTLSLEDIINDVPKINNVIKTIENPDYIKNSKILKRMMVEAIKNNYNETKKPKCPKDFEILNFIMPTNCLMYLRQLSSGFISNNQIKDFKGLKFENPKLDQLKSLLENTNDNAVVFYNFQQECDDICEMLKKELPHKKLIIINGENKYEKSKSLIDSITNQSEDYVLVGQCQACGIGLNLQFFSHLSIYYSLPLSTEVFQQSLGRTNRVGQKSPLFYYYLITKDSIDEKIWKSLETNQTYTEKMFEVENGIN